MQTDEYSLAFSIIKIYNKKRLFVCSICFVRIRIAFKCSQRGITLKSYNKLDDIPKLSDKSKDKNREINNYMCNSQIYIFSFRNLNGHVGQSVNFSNFDHLKNRFENETQHCDNVAMLIWWLSTKIVFFCFNQKATTETRALRCQNGCFRTWFIFLTNCDDYLYLCSLHNHPYKVCHKISFGS